MFLIQMIDDIQFEHRFFLNIETRVAFCINSIFFKEKTGLIRNQEISTAWIELELKENELKLVPFNQFPK